jgi:hypothetical protein
MTESFGEDNEIGEQIDEEYQTVDHSEIRPGDRILFKYRHRAFAAQGGWTELAGVVVYVLPGFELVYVVKVMGGTLPWPDLFVARRDVFRVVV